MDLGEGSGGAAARLEFNASAIGGDQRWEFAAPAGTTLVMPVTLARLAGEYAVPYHTPPVGFIAEGTLSVDDDGLVCIRYRPQEGEDCDRRGRLSVPEGDLGVIDFVLQTSGYLGRPDRGRGWLAMVDGVETLSLIGIDGEVGHYLLARRR